MTPNSETIDFQAIAADTFDRRRDGRSDVAPTLVQLFRDPVGENLTDQEYEARWVPRDPIAPPRGILLALALGLPIWLGVGALLYSALR